jgi:hypothetical protein
VVDRQCRPRYHVFIIHIRNDADNATRLRAAEWWTCLGPPELTVQRVVIRKQSLRDAFAHDHDGLVPRAIAVGEGW